LLPLTICLLIPPSIVFRAALMAFLFSPRLGISAAVFCLLAAVIAHDTRVFSTALPHDDEFFFSFTFFDFIRLSPSNQAFHTCNIFILFGVLVFALLPLFLPFHRHWGDGCTYDSGHPAGVIKKEQRRRSSPG
jgi:hypothetical protein